MIKIDLWQGAKLEFFQRWAKIIFNEGINYWIYFFLRKKLNLNLTFTRNIYY